MNGKRLVLALLVALTISGLFTFWLSKRVAKTTHPAAPQKHQYVVAARPLDAGEVLNPANVQLADWPLSSPLDGSFTGIDKVSGRTVLYPLSQGEPILERQLAAAGSGVGLSANIPPGMRATSLRSNEVAGVAGFLQPGAHVDVLMTYHPEKAPSEERTATVLQDVVVLTAGQQLRPDPEGKPTTSNVVTLLLSPQDAEKAVLATSLGPIHFIMRNASDREHVVNPSVGLNELADSSSPATSIASAARFLHPKPLQYDVQVILGDRSVVNSFR